ncbi:DUF1801 domain-containing protein [Haloflavibacter putidus]|uniref:DUF1801 domain-containing protein n=1 Tax=Haloflavibacter putidus TaxID=2576776 RepID=A0A507ZLJ3_9FLAO|nr:DUF1801 domain-containing protein [Haloflavibacter putidus]
MKKSENLDVHNFLDKIKRIDTEKSNILIEIRQIIFDFFPEADERIMYDGIVFFFKDEMFSGLFLNKKHVTLEFSKGFLMKDPQDFLEGRGKYRRHLKFRTREAIVNYDVPFFVQQAL